MEIFKGICVALLIILSAVFLGGWCVFVWAPILAYYLEKGLE